MAPLSEWKPIVSTICRSWPMRPDSGSNGILAVSGEGIVSRRTWSVPSKCSQRQTRGGGETPRVSEPDAEAQGTTGTTLDGRVHYRVAPTERKA